MSIEWVLYLIDAIGKAGFIFIFGMVFSVIAVIVLLMKLSDDSIGYCSEENKLLRMENFKRRLKICIMVFFTSLFFNALFPSPQTMYTIILAHYSKQSEIPQKVLKAIEIKLDEIIEGVKK